MSTLINVTIMAISFIFFIMDFARAKPDPANYKANFNYHFTMVVIIIIVLVPSAVLLTELENSGIILYEEKVFAISEIFFLLLVRKIAPVLVFSIFKYLCAINNTFAQRYKHYLVTETLDPNSPKPIELNLEALRLGHTVLWFLSIVIFSVASATPFVTNSRINVFLNQIENLYSKFFSLENRDRIIFAIWAIGVCIFFVRLYHYFIGVYENYIRELQKKRTENLKVPRTRLIKIFIIRKLISYVLIMDNYVLEDFIFWWTIAWIVIGISYYKYLKRVKNKADNRQSIF